MENTNATTEVSSTWERMAKPWQRMPAGDWTTWRIEAGRGEGATRAGAEATIQIAREAERMLRDGILPLRDARLAAIGPSMSVVRETMVVGSSGLLQNSPWDFQPIYVPSKRVIVYPGGVEVHLFGCDDLDSTRGRQWMWIWCDAFSGTARAQETLTSATLGLRLGPHPRRLISVSMDGRPSSITSTP